MNNPYDALEAVSGGPEIMAKYLSYDHVGPDMKLEAIAPNMAKIVRLTFHDCIKEAGGAGCNGCLNFEGMGNLYELDECGQGQRKKCSTIAGGIRPKKGPFATDNNNLQWVARVLEEVYKDPNYGPDNLQGFKVSLFESGKSRADLWAYAGLVAVQYGTEANNVYCNPTKDKPAPCYNQVNKDSPSCFIDLPIPNFRTGRSDCVPSCTGEHDFDFCTTNHEFHPSPHGNGDETINFFRKHFKFAPEESAALMGVHTIGHPQEYNSMFRHYSWTGRIQRWMFNNQYYKFIVNAKNYRFLDPKLFLLPEGSSVKDCGLDVSTHIGNEHGNPFTTKYVVRNEKRTEAGGPWDWQLMGKGCSKAICAKMDPAEYSINSCCHWLDLCLNPPDHKKFKCPDKKYVCEGAEGCTEHNIFQKVSMLSPDMGLFLNFTVDADGRPAGCHGLEDKGWLNNWKRSSPVVDCPLNLTPTTDDGTLAEVMQIYADDQDAWIKDFVAVFDKMLENGVDKDALIDASNVWFDAVCDDKQKVCTAA